MKRFMNNIRFVTTLLLVEVVAFFVSKISIWLQLLFKPYTHVGASMMALGQHIGFAVVGFWVSLMIHSYRGLRR